MSSFEKCWPVLKSHEGTRYTNYSWDPGGATKYGITLRYAQSIGALDEDHDGKPDIVLDLNDDGVIDEKDIMLIDEPKAMEIYGRWWRKCGYSKIVDQMVATKVMDISVNLGPRGVTKSGRIIGAHIMVQRAINACGYKLLEDGYLGPVTFAALNECDPRELLIELCHLQVEHYRAWCDKDESREVAREGLHARASWPFVNNGYAV